MKVHGKHSIAVQTLRDYASNVVRPLVPESGKFSLGGTQESKRSRGAKERTASRGKGKWKSTLYRKIFS